MLFVKKTFRHGGYVPGYKEGTSQSAILDIPVPEEVVIPLGQYGGECCEPCVAPGDRVEPGQVIGRGLRFPAVCHTSVAGTVVAITRCADVDFVSVPAVHIRTEGDQDFVPLPCRVPESMSADELLEAVAQAGIQEDDPLDNPLYTRLTEARKHKATTLIINGMESEPYLTSQGRSLQERSALLIFGARAALKLIGAERGVLALPSNAADTVDTYQRLLADEPAMDVAVLSPKYPQGGHNQLVKVVTGREVPAGALSSAAGAVVLNVSTLVAMGETLVSGKPVMDGVISVGGPRITAPGNYRVRMGTPLSQVLAWCGIDADEQDVLWGGPLTGTVVSNVNIPISKNCPGIVVLPREYTTHKAKPFGPCVNCARCVEQCPQMLYPNRLSLAAEKGNIKTMAGLHITGCIECGLCSYVCPANRPTTQMIRACKKALWSGEGGDDR